MKIVVDNPSSKVVVNESPVTIVTNNETTSVRVVNNDHTIKVVNNIQVVKIVVPEPDPIKIVTNNQTVKVNVTGARGAAGPTGSYKATSTQNVNPTIGYLALTIAQTAMPYSIGQRIRVVAFDDPQNYFEGYVDAYEGSNILYLYVDMISVGHYEYNSWVINMTGEPGRDLYAQAVDEGFEGSFDDFIASLYQSTDGFIFNETPTGVMNAVNKVFTTNNNFISTKTRLYLNGMRMKLNEDYTESGPSEITFTEAPHSGDNIIIDYLIIP